jgi:hypothetical protein
LGGVEPERRVELDDLVAACSQTVENDAGARVDTDVVRAKTEDAQKNSKQGRESGFTLLFGPRD